MVAPKKEPGKTSAETGKAPKNKNKTSRKPRGSLSREVILEAALAISDTEGIEAITIRKIASKLGASPMGVYRHFKNKVEILSGLVDRVIGIYDVTNHDVDPSDWESWSRETCTRMRSGLVSHPGIISLLGSSAEAGESVVNVLEAFLGVLRQAGFEEEAVSLFFSLISYTVGSSAIESSVVSFMVTLQEREMGEVLTEMKERYANVPLDRYPNVIASASHLIDFSKPEEFTYGLNAMLSTAARSLKEKK
jgi:AcrR family transcriptional regulator